MALPIVTSVTPSSGPPAGGTAVTIGGAHFTGTTDVLFSGLPASFAVVDDSTITATTPGGSGSNVVEIVNADGSSEDPIPPTMLDSSGSGNDVPYDPDNIGNIVVEIPGLVVGNDAARIDGGETNAIAGDAPLAAGLGTGDLFMCGWMQSDVDLADGDVPIVAQLGASSDSVFGFALYIVVGPSPDATIVVHRSVHDPDVDLDVDDGVAVAVVTLDTNPHLFTVTYEDATNTYTAYFDDALVAAATGTHLGIPGLEPDHVDYIGHGGTTQLTFDEVAWGPRLLSPTDVANLFAAGADFGTYNSLMLALGPTGYYHLDETRGVSGIFTYKAAQGWHVGRVGVGPI